MTISVLNMYYSVLNFMTFLSLHKNIRPNNHYILISHTYGLFLALFTGGIRHA